MIIVGSEGKVVDLGVKAHKHCPVCERVRPFHIYLQYVYNHFWYIFGYSTGRKYTLSCEICGRGSDLDRKEVESTLDKSPLPMMHRYGCLVGIVAAIVAILLSVGIVAFFDR